ncbi:MAG TPA: peptide chain release factor N(5)-glutamine methyltransferase [Verrucomicrobiae bacterium]|nr:peptide chain release factor N(5)-glutamine methyltransferase [Verrucomicrobiae bacterium]
MESQDSNLFKELNDRYASVFIPPSDKPDETAETTIKALWLCAAGKPVPVEDAMSTPLPALTPATKEKLSELLQARLRGIPLAYVVGRQKFMGLEFLCDENALIPRKETEILGNAIFGLLRDEVLPTTPRARVVDLCTGSGNLACAIGFYFPVSVVFGIDISNEAIELANRNVQRLGLGERVKLLCGDMFAPLEGELSQGLFDMITCNPPYIDPSKFESMNPEIIAHEPKAAFDGGPFGVRILWRLIDEAPRYLKNGGWLAFEVGLGQGEAIKKRIAKNPRFEQVKGFTDAACNIRAIAARFNASPGPALSPSQKALQPNQAQQDSTQEPRKC